MTSSLPSRYFKIRYGRQDDPLAEFYLPALERAVRYDLLLGFASSETLARATAGLQRLVLRGGHVRLLCGVGLNDDDTAAVREGATLEEVVTRTLLRDLSVSANPVSANPVSADPVPRGRFESIAWMLAHQHLTIRLVLPLGDDGIPLERAAARPFHQPWEGVIRDAEGHKLVWSGDPEAFWTFASFRRGKGDRRIDEAPSHVRAVVTRFESLWRSETPDWRTLDLPTKVRDALLALCPEEAPTRDPLEKTLPPRIARAASVLSLGEGGGPIDERLLFRFLSEAPFLPNARDLGVATSAVEPWPHQLRVVRRVTHRFPASFLFCDEVGLGKTIEAGLALRQLIVSGRVKRALLLVPKNVLRQWQEELYEKIALHIPRLEGDKLIDVFGRKIPIKKKGRSRGHKNPWNAVPVILASSHLARRRERQGEVLRADPWDLVIVDEAHHARRTDFRPGHDRPNKLLELLAGSAGRRGLKDRTRCLYLLTATPMQVHPVELWDLLRLLGLGGRWGALEEHFLRFHEELRLPFRKRDWPFLVGMLSDALETVGGVDPAFRRLAIERLGAEGWSVIESLGEAADPNQTASGLGPPARQVLDEMLRRHTPITNFVLRNTRKLLRRYRMQGILRANVPERRPENVWIPFKDDEKALYERIEAYIVDFYQRYEAERRGLGFLMTVYRRRLTSSFFAIRRSLERRLAYLSGKDLSGEDLSGEDPSGEDPSGEGLLIEDFEQDDLEDDLEVSEGGEFHEHRRSEQAYLEDFLRDLGALGRDSKVERLFRDLEKLLRERDTALVFTQYTDTMDHLREELRPVYGEHLACYSGRGGEVWDGEGWKARPKEEVKEAFRSGEIRVLLATESASEGLNLQTCGILINFDMPWNPMRVEQRIGRIDRIGQTFREVWICNYFYEDSVEAVIYQRLSDRIRWFEQVLGRLQPILHRVGEVIERVVMLQGAQRARGIEEHLTALGMDLDQPALDQPLEDLRADDPFGDEAFGGEAPSENQELETPVTLADLEAALVSSEAFGRLFSPHPSVAEAYGLRWSDKDRAVTFSVEVFDRFPNSVELITWGHPLLAELLGSVEAPALSDEPTGLGLYRTRRPEPLSLFLYPDGQRARAITDPRALGRAMSEPVGKWPGSAEGAAVSLFSEARQRRLKVLQGAADERLRAQQRALAEGARQVLRRAALLTLAQGQHATLFEDVLPYGFGTEAVLALRQRGAPFAALLDLVRDAMDDEVNGEVSARSDDPYFLRIQGRPPEDLKRKSKALVTEGKEIVARHTILTGASPHPEPEPGTVFERLWFPLVEEGALSDVSRQPPFRVLDASEVRPFENAVPVYDDLESVVWRFAETPDVEEASWNPADDIWVEFEGRTVPQPGLFLVRVTGEAMNRRVPSGSWCLFRLTPQGCRNGQIALVRCEGQSDPETGSGAMLRIYESQSQTEPEGDGAWHPRIILRPMSTDPSFQSIRIEDPEPGGFQILAELVEVFL